MSTSKMSQATVIFNEVNDEGFDLQGKTQRSVFIERAMLEVGLTKAGASTYHQNLRNKFINGKSLYEYNKTATKTKEVYVPEFRWLVLINGKVVASYPTRSKAQRAAKEMNGKWGDITKA